MHRYRLLLVLLMSFMLTVGCKKYASVETVNSITESKDSITSSASIKSNQIIKTPNLSVTEGALISSPFQFSMMACREWPVFEGEIAIAKLIDTQNKLISSSILSTVDGRWMEDSCAAFTTTMTYNIDRPQKAKLVVTSKQTADSDPLKTMSIHVNLEPSQVKKK
jgi:hypothetical protein